MIHLVCLNNKFSQQLIVFDVITSYCKFINVL